MREPVEDFDRHLQRWLTPDDKTVERVRTRGFDAARRRRSRGAPLLAVIGAAAAIGVAIVARHAATTASDAVAGHPIERSPAPASAEVQSARRQLTLSSDGRVMLLRAPDGTIWIGDVAGPTDRPPAGTGSVVIEGGAR